MQKRNEEATMRGAKVTKAEFFKQIKDAKVLCRTRSLNFKRILHSLVNIQNDRDEEGKLPIHYALRALEKERFTDYNVFHYLWSEDINAIEGQRDEQRSLGNSSNTTEFKMSSRLTTLHLLLTNCTEEHGRVWVWLKAASRQSKTKPDIFVQSHSGQNALHYAAFKFIPGHSGCIFDCLLSGETSQSLIDMALVTRDENGYSPLHVFCQNVRAQSVAGDGELESIVDKLIDSRKEVLEQESDKGTPLHVAISSIEPPLIPPYVRLLRKLTTCGNLRMRNSRGDTPLHLVAFHIPPLMHTFVCLMRELCVSRKDEIWPSLREMLLEKNFHGDSPLHLLARSPNDLTRFLERESLKEIDFNKFGKNFCQMKVADVSAMCTNKRGGMESLKRVRERLLEQEHSLPTALSVWGKRKSEENSKIRKLFKSGLDDLEEKISCEKSTRKNNVSLNSKVTKNERIFLSPLDQCVIKGGDLQREKYLVSAAKENKAKLVQYLLFWHCPVPIDILKYVQSMEIMANVTEYLIETRQIAKVVDEKSRLLVSYLASELKTAKNRINVQGTLRIKYFDRPIQIEEMAKMKENVIWKSENQLGLKTDNEGFLQLDSNKVDKIKQKLLHFFPEDSRAFFEFYVEETKMSAPKVMEDKDWTALQNGEVVWVFWGMESISFDCILDFNLKPWETCKPRDSVPWHLEEYDSNELIKKGRLKKVFLFYPIEKRRGRATLGEREEELYWEACRVQTMARLKAEFKSVSSFKLSKLLTLYRCSHEPKFVRLRDLDEPSSWAVKVQRLIAKHPDSTSERCIPWTGGETVSSEQKKQECSTLYYAVDLAKLNTEAEGKFNVASDIDKLTTQILGAVVVKGARTELKGKQLENEKKVLHYVRTYLIENTHRDEVQRYRERIVEFIGINEEQRIVLEGLSVLEKNLLSLQQFGMSLSLLEQIVHYAICIAEGAHLLHSMSVVHRDLALRNVVLRQLNASERGYDAVIVDFGLSAILEASANARRDRESNPSLSLFSAFKKPVIIEAELPEDCYAVPVEAAPEYEDRILRESDVWSFSWVIGQMLKLIFTGDPHVNVSSDGDAMEEDPRGARHEDRTHHEIALMRKAKLNACVSEAITNWVEKNSKHLEEGLIRKVRAISDKLYSIMQSCMKESPLERPSFIQLSKTLKELL